jgi:hypothetical protein
VTVTNAYCTVEDVRSQLGDSTSTFDTALLEKAVNAASRAVEDWTGRRFWKDLSLVARTFRPSRCDKARLDDFASTAGLVVETRTAAGGSWSAWTLDSDFEVGPDNADADGGAYAWNSVVAVGARSFPLARYRTLRVTATWGWSQVPDQVVEATVLKATALFKRRDAPFGVAGFSDFGAVRITRDDPDVVRLLARFQKVLAA